MAFRGLPSPAPLARAEDGGADAHVGGAGHYGLLVIVAHPHGQGVPATGGEGRQCGEQLCHACEAFSRIGVWVENGHEAAHADPFKTIELLQQSCGRGRVHARLAGIGVYVHLETDLQRFAVRALLVQPPRDLESVHGVNPVEVLGHLAGLVRLQRANEVPRQRQLRELGDLRQRFLKIVFAKVAQPGTVGLFDGVGRLPLGDRNQADVAGIPVSGPCSRRNRGTHVGDVVGDGVQFRCANCVADFACLRQSEAGFMVKAQGR